MKTINEALMLECFYFCDTIKTNASGRCNVFASLQYCTISQERNAVTPPRQIEKLTRPCWGRGQVPRLAGPLNLPFPLLYFPCRLRGVKPPKTNQRRHLLDPIPIPNLCCVPANLQPHPCTRGRSKSPWPIRRSTSCCYLFNVLAINAGSPGHPTGKRERKLINEMYVLQRLPARSWGASRGCAWRRGRSRRAAPGRRGRAW